MARAHPTTSDVQPEFFSYSNKMLSHKTCNINYIVKFGAMRSLINFVSYMYRYMFIHEWDIFFMQYSCITNNNLDLGDFSFADITWHMEGLMMNVCLKFAGIWHFLVCRSSQRHLQTRTASSSLMLFLFKCKIMNVCIHSAAKKNEG